MAYIGNSPANVGNYQIVDDISSSFNGSTTSFALASGGLTITPAKSGQLLVGVNGVMQEPDDTGTNGFKVSGSNVVFSSAPASGDTFWAVYQGQNVDIGTPSDGTVGTAQLADGSVTAAKIADGTVVAAEIADNAVTTAKINADAVTGAKIADNAIGNEHLEDDAVGIAELSASGTASSSTYLRGDNSWSTVDALPSQSGHNGKYLTTNGSAASWATLDTDANTTTKGLYEHAHTISANYSITSGNNAMTAGPITINSSVSVTVPSGSTWVIA